MDTKLCGVIEENKNIFFVLDGYVCTFINSKPEDQPKTILTQKNGFIIGKIIGGNKTRQFVYIYAGKDLTVRESHTLSTELYLISKDPELVSYQGIQLKGGILNKLYLHSQWDTTFIDDNNDDNNDNDNDDNDMASVTVKFSDDYKEFKLSNKKVEGTLSIGAGVTGSKSIEKGSSLSTQETELEILFKNEKGLKTFPDVFSYVRDLCRFMAFRKNVRFNEIALLKKSEYLSGVEFNEKVATCYMRFEESSEISKSAYQCITFNVLGDCVNSLLSCIADDDSKATKFNIGFLPENDKDVNLVTSMRVREVISALESELEINKIKNQNSEEFEELVNKLKLVVKEHKTGETPLKDPKEYDYIFSALGHITSSLANRIYILMQEYKPLVMNWLSKEKIEALVKYRNKITHGGFSPLDQELAKSTIFLMGLVYCSILKRIGMEDEKIKKLFHQNILS